MASREMNGKEDAKTSNSRDFFVGAFIGALAGAAAALLLTPKSGKDLRSTIDGQTSQLKDRALYKSNGLASVVKEKANTVAHNVTQQSNELIQKVRGSVREEDNNFGDEIQRKLEETQRAFDETEQKLNH
ncbi:YtxH domain-containing protein [Mesobacillus maritimus]|uniref:YtxH domain-containing protein n=1 Tax=Mesobacillus maritimus TaxID=1643336 RepID=UPI00203C4048|nr:YtxH domain-containing protein [Mesobacillus maritimus]MCM3587909.1 YtxH domain-containing protein [Mesobacillus maritimus]MCM3670083.1 YtxH domain-containing protein [Mesobacillus maritimus]